jgi:hypothetical protein
MLSAAKHPLKIVPVRAALGFRDTAQFSATAWGSVCNFQWSGPPFDSPRGVQQPDHRLYLQGCPLDDFIDREMGIEKFPNLLLRIAHGAHRACSCSPDAAVDSGNPGAVGLPAAHISMPTASLLLY